MDDGFIMATLLHGTNGGRESEPSEEVQSPSAVEEDYPGTESGELDYTIRNDDLKTNPVKMIPISILWSLYKHTRRK